MSYNIDRWTTKEIDNLVIPVSVVSGMKDITARFCWSGNNDFPIELTGICEGFKLNGMLVNLDNGLEAIKVSTIEYWGVASGSRYDILEKLLKASTGKLVAVQVWEGGDSIVKLTVADGVLTEEQIEL